MLQITADQIMDFMAARAAEQEIPDDVFHNESNKHDYSVKLNKQVVLNFFIGKKIAHITTRSRYEFDLSAAADARDQAGGTRIYIGSLDELERLQAFFSQVLKKEFDNLIENPFSCCHRYVECSDAKACIHPDTQHQIGCSYRRHLLAGRIFYGINMNI